MDDYKIPNFVRVMLIFGGYYSMTQWFSIDPNTALLIAGAEFVHLIFDNLGIEW